MKEERGRHFVDTTHTDTSRMGCWTSTADKRKLDGIEDFAQVNVIEEVRVNGKALAIAEKMVDILIKTGKMDGTVSVQGVDVPVKGLMAMAYKENVSYSDLTVALKKLLDGKADQEEVTAIVQDIESDISGLQTKMGKIPNTIIYDAPDYASQETERISLAFGKMNLNTDRSSTATVYITGATSEKAGVMTAADKTKLDSLENYDDTELRGSIPTKVSELENDSNYQTQAEVDERFEHLIGAAPAALDTLEEIAEKLSDNDDVHTALVNSIAEKVTKPTNGTSSQFLKADGSVDSTAYLPKSGGTIKNGNRMDPLYLDTTNSSCALYFKTQGTTKASIGYKDSAGEFEANGHKLRICDEDHPDNPNELIYDDYKVWTEYNDGSGSGLDADLLDGKHDGELTANKIKYVDMPEELTLESLGNETQVFIGKGDNDKNIEYAYRTLLSVGNGKSRRFIIYGSREDSNGKANLYYRLPNDKFTELGKERLFLDDHNYNDYCTKYLKLPRYDNAELNDYYLEGETKTSNEAYFRACLKWICANYSGRQVFYGAGEPNSLGLVQIIVYDTSKTNDEGLPEYSLGRVTQLGGDSKYFGTQSYVWKWDFEVVGTANDAKKLNNQSADYYLTKNKTFAILDNASSTHSLDANELTNGGMYRNYSGGSKWINAPSGMSYGTILHLTGDNGLPSLSGQLAWDINHDSETPTRNLWWRGASSTHQFQNDWKQIAFTDSNVASADKLTRQVLEAETNLNLVLCDDFTIFDAPRDCKNAPPFSNTFTLIVFKNAYQDRYVQIAIFHQDIYIRSRGISLGAYYWNDWKKILTEDDVPKQVVINVEEYQFDLMEQGEHYEWVSDNRAEFARLLKDPTLDVIFKFKDIVVRPTCLKMMGTYIIMIIPFFDGSVAWFMVYNDGLTRIENR